jgi:DNA-binding transcriptional MocR family regulator
VREASAEGGGQLEAAAGRHVCEWLAPCPFSIDRLTNTEQQWLKVDHTRHPDAGTKSVFEIEEEIFNSCIGRGVLVARGSWFRAEQDKPLSGLYFRTTFAAATPENMTEAIRRLGEAIRESYRL